MPSQIPENISDFAARNISLNQLRKWSEAGEKHREDLSVLIKDIRSKLYRSSSPAKVITQATKSLKIFFSQKDVRGEVNFLNNRHIEFKLAFPELENHGLQFCLIYGEINARTKACKFDKTVPVRISVHALQRLLTRLESTSDENALDEIYSCIKLAIPWHQASSESGAQCWPLISEHGFFVGTSNPNSLVTTLITWMGSDGLSKKWLQPLQNLRKLKAIRPAKLEDMEFAREFLISFPWMLKEHVPGVDLASIAWESKDFDTEDDLISQVGSEEEIDPILVSEKKQSSSYLAGLNYSQTLPPFRIYDRVKGLVVQKREDNILIVGLKNGWAGNIPNVSIERGKRLIENYQTPEIGDEIDVSIQKIRYLNNEEAYLISLDPIEVANANWLEIEKSIPLNSEVRGRITVDLRGKYGVQLIDGNRGIIDKSTVLGYLQSIKSVNKNPVDLELNFKVIGFSPARKNIILSISNLTEAQKDVIASSVEVGHTYLGTCIHAINSYSVIRLDNGHTGMLHRNNCWGTPLPNVGDSVEVSVIFINMDEYEISFSTVRSSSNNFNCMPMTQELWNTFTNRYIVGDVLDVQIRDWIDESQAFIVATHSGVRGVISKKEIAWSASIGDIPSEISIGDVFPVKIIKINDKKMKVSFSKRMTEPHPLDDPEILKIKGHIYSGQVTKVVDYGYFIALPLLKVDGLLHKTRIPDGLTLEKNAQVDVCIVEVDLERKRLGLSLTASDASV